MSAARCGHDCDDRSRWPSLPQNAIVAGMRAAILAIHCVLAAVSVPAASAQSIKVIGQGVATCGRWSAVRKEGTGFGYEQWVVGYLSGVTAATAGKVNPLNNVDADGVWAWFDNYCQRHPLDTIASAAFVFSVAHPH